jgi:poly(3-hydroxybutyrate) depolymerase
VWCSALLLAVSSMACSGKRKKGPPPLSAPSWTVELEAKGFQPASVALPLGATTPRPIAVVLHGAADRPEWQCGTFRGLLGGRVFILCPAGMARPELAPRLGLGNVDETATELRALLAELKQRFGPYVAPSPILLIGYAEGAALAAELARQEPSFFARVALVGGDPTALSPTAAAVFAIKGGKRMLFFCTSPACQGDGVQRALLLTRRGISAKSVQHEVGPYLDDAFVSALRGDLPWLVEDDARWPKSR